jgi:hypothetical protein
MIRRAHLEERSPFFFPLSLVVNKYKNPCGAEGEKLGSESQGLEDAILYHSFSFEHPAEKC